jgi:hypothetical protein
MSKKYGDRQSVCSPRCNTVANGLTGGLSAHRRYDGSLTRLSFFSYESKTLIEADQAATRSGCVVTFAAGF